MGGFERKATERVKGATVVAFIGSTGQRIDNILLQRRLRITRKQLAAIRAAIDRNQDLENNAFWENWKILG